MARSRTPDEVKVSVKWDAANSQWIANATAVTKEGANKKVVAAGTSTTKALHRAEAMFADLHDGPFEFLPDIQIPEQEREEFTAFAKDLKVFEALKDRIKDKRVELATRFSKKYHMPVRTLAPLLGMSQQRLGKLMADFEMGLPAPGPVGRPRSRTDDDDD